MPKAGIVGVGRIGLPIARNLIAAGFEVSGFRRSAAAEFTAIGGQLCASAREVAASSPVVIVCVPDVDALHETVDALVEEGHDGQVVIEMSTFALETKEAERDRLAGVGIEMLDCPVLGLPPMVASRTAVVLASGDVAAHQRIVPVLDGITDRHVYTGTFGNGSKFKYVANSLVASNTVAAAEAMVLASRLGLDLPNVIATLRGSAADSVMLQAKGPMMAAHRYSPSLGPVGLLAKDVEVIVDVATAAQLHMPSLAVSQALLQRALDHGSGDDDTASLFELINEPSTEGRPG